MSPAARRAAPSILLPALLAAASLAPCGCRHGRPAPAGTVPVTVAVAVAGDAVPPVTRRFAFVETGLGLPRNGQWRNGFDIADMNGDGLLDIVVGPPRKGPRRPHVFVADGHGAFHLWSEAHFPALAYDYGAAAAGDLNGDGISDLVLACHLSGITALLGEGRGVFSPYAEGLELRRPDATAGPPDFTSRVIALTDWNRDGRPDLVALAEGPTRGDVTPATGAPAGARRGLRVLINHSGAWESLAGDPAASRLFGSSLAVGDVDADGHPDAVTAAAVQGENRILHLGNGRGWTTVAVRALRPGAFVWAVAVADIDGDRRDDVAIAYSVVRDGAWTSGVDLLRSAPGAPGAFERRTVYAEDGRRHLGGVAVGDLDGDGASDLVAVAEDGEVLTFAGDGAGFLTRDEAIPAPDWRRGCAASAVRLADLDGDGGDEIVAAFAGERGALDPAHVCPSGGAIQAWKVVAARAALPRSPSP